MLRAISGLNTTAPKVWAPRTIHVVLTVRYGGEPNLYSYRRVLVTVNYR